MLKYHIIGGRAMFGITQSWIKTPALRFTRCDTLAAMLSLLLSVKYTDDRFFAGLSED